MRQKIKANETAGRICEAMAKTGVDYKALHKAIADAIIDAMEDAAQDMRNRMEQQQGFYCGGRDE